MHPAPKGVGSRARHNNEKALVEARVAETAASPPAACAEKPAFAEPQPRCNKEGGTDSTAASGDTRTPAHGDATGADT